MKVIIACERLRELKREMRVKKRGNKIRERVKSSLPFDCLSIGR